MTNFFVEPKTITLNKVDYSISPLKVKDIGKAARAASPLISALSGDVNVVMVLENAETVIELCAIASNQSIETVGELNAAELVALLTLVVEVNSSFFSQSIVPQVTTMMKAVQAVAPKGGMNP